MIKNYIKIAFRNIFRHKAYAAINISGLALGIACCVLLYMAVTYEMGYDKFQPNYDRVMQVVTQDKFDQGLSYTPGVPFPMTDALRADMPDTKIGAIYSAYGCQVTVLKKGNAGEKFIEDSGVFFIEPQFFDVFNYKWLSGDAKVLAEPNMVALSKTMAEKYFGDWHNAVGKSILLDNVATMKVAAILDDVPAHSDFPLQVIGSFVTIKNYPATYNYNPDWGSNTSNYQVFMLPPQGVNKATIDARLATLKPKYYGKDRFIKRSHFVRPLSEVHFDTRFGNFGTHVTSKSKLITLSLIGVFIIIMACINFINLATAQAVTRSKEVGVRKVLGGSRIQLFWQMMGETGIMVIVATVLALIIALVTLPYIKNIMSIAEPLTILHLDVMVFLMAGIILVTFLAGIYPSLILSGFTPALALKNKITSASVGGISLRRGLVVMQFAISQVLIIGTIIAVSQMDFVGKADLGFNKDAVLLLNSSNVDSTITSRQEAFKQKLLQLPGVEAVSSSSDAPSSENNWGSNFAYDHRPDEEFNIYLKFADPDYFKTFSIKFIAGGPYNLADTVTGVVVNETLQKKLNVKRAEDMIGRQIHLGGNNPWRVITGVVHDFKTNSLREAVRPVYIANNRRYYYTTSVKLHTADIPATQKAIQQTWDRYFPEYASTFGFMDKNIEAFYEQENQLSLVYKIFAGIAIFISCLGLYGLVSFMAVQRTKEVGIRKVLGAGVGHIVYLFSKEFTLLILAAFVVATPLAYYMMHNWLNNFVFRINMSAWIFVIAVVISVIIAWATVGIKAIKAALANPVKSLRSE